MMRRAVLATVLLVAFAPGVTAQEPDPEAAESNFYRFSLEPTSPPPPQLPAGGDFWRVELAFEDHSRDDTAAVGGPQMGTFAHDTALSYQIIEGDVNGWLVTSMPKFSQAYAGDVREGSFKVKPLLTVKEPNMKLLITAVMKDQRSGITVEQNITLSFLTVGQTVWNVSPKGGLDLAPLQVGTATVAINHQGLLPRTFHAELNENPCNLEVVPFPTVSTKEKGFTEVTFNVQGPEDKFWYASENCDISFSVYPDDNPSDIKRLSISVTVSGTQVDPVWIFNTVAVLLAAFIIFLLIARRKARIEEEILGRPQKPWLIPVEQVYLEHLRERDPQAHYVVRHFLMEEEYASSLLWYKEFKKATRGTRAKERLVVGQEHKYERFQKRWQRRIAAPHKKVDRLAAGLQKKLDREGKAGARKARRNWKKLTKQMRAAHEKKAAKADKKWKAQHAKWTKQAAKAQKKGAAVPEEPPKPQLAEPDYPPEPSGDRILLEQHKWNKKVVKARAKATKKSGNLEVKFEKKDAKMLRKVRRKVQKIARKLDDPEFASEHPLLAAES